MNADEFQSDEQPVGESSAVIGDAALAEVDRAPYLRPRLAIGHLLLWTALSATWLALYRWAFLNERPDSAYFTIRPGAFEMLMLSAASLPVGGWWLGLLIYPPWRARGMQIPFFPGEWLWICRGAQSLTQSLAFILGFRWLTENGMLHSIRWLDGFLLLTAIFFLPAVLIVRQPARWKRLFRIIFALEILGPGWRMLAGGPMGYLAGPGGQLAIDLATLAVGWREWRLGLRLPWTHWLSIVLCVPGALLAVAQIVRMVAM